MSYSSVMAHCPSQLNLLPDSRIENAGVAFTLSPALGLHETPTYREPSHLAAWLVGYWSGHAAAVKELAKEIKEGN